MTTRAADPARGDEKHEAHSAENPAPEAGMSRDTINIGMNIFKSGIKRYSEKEQELLEWLWGYSYDILNGSRSALCDSTGYDWTVIHKIFTGMYDASLDRFCEKIAHLKKMAAKNGMRLVETPVTRRIEEALDYCRDLCAMVAIKGPTGRSKTFTAKCWARNNNHGRSKYVRVPSGCTRRTLVQQLCKSCGIGISGLKTATLEDRLFKAFDFRNVIIIDEAGHLLPRFGIGTSAIEFLRDLHDICGCGVAMIFTDVYLEEMRNGRLASYYEQFMGRIKFEVPIPTEVMKSETAAVVKAFRKDAPEKLLSYAHKIANNRDGKLRTLFEDLQRAKDWADKSGHEVGYDDLKVAVDWRLSGGTWQTGEDLF